MRTHMNLFLIGYRCTGKTTVGRVLADRLGWSFVDTDSRIVDAAGISVARLVERIGWPGFRTQERQVLAAVAAGSRQVVATGGGIVLDTSNIETMKTSGLVVWLTASERTIATRMLADDKTSGNRPALTDRGPFDEIAAVLAERRPLYERAADLTLATDQETIETICDRIIDHLATQ